MLGVLIDKVAYAPLREAPRLSILITAIGVSYLLENGIIGGFDLGKYYPELENVIMFAVTEKRTKEEIDKLCKVLDEVLQNLEEHT